MAAKPPARRIRGSAARWNQTAGPYKRWVRQADGKPPSYEKYDVVVPAPKYDDATYESHLTHADWSKEETDYLMDLYRHCYGKWPVIIDEYFYGNPRTMEDLKSRFYNVQATLLALQTPITSMTASEYELYQTLKNFDPLKEASRKKLAEGHLKRPRNEVDEETTLLTELQRIMLNQASLDADREDLRRRLDHPVASTNGYQYSTSQALTGLWQQLLAADRMRKNQRLRPTIPEQPVPGHRPSRDSLPSASAAPAPPQVGTDLSKQDQQRFGVTHSTDKLPSGISFASDKLSKPRMAKSTIQTDKIAAILTHIGVPDLIPLPSPAVVEQFDAIMTKVHTLLDMRKVAEREEQELRTRQAEAAA
jgi:DNA methyltransferase 1-associated protein 1